MAGQEQGIQESYQPTGVQPADVDIDPYALPSHATGSSRNRSLIIGGLTIAGAAGAGGVILACADGSSLIPHKQETPTAVTCNTTIQWTSKGADGTANVLSSTYFDAAGQAHDLLNPNVQPAPSKDCREVQMQLPEGSKFVSNMDAAMKMTPAQLKPLSIHTWDVKHQRERDSQFDTTFLSATIGNRALYRGLLVDASQVTMSITENGQTKSSDFVLTATMYVINGQKVMQLSILQPNENITIGVPVNRVSYEGGLSDYQDATNNLQFGFSIPVETFLRGFHQREFNPNHLYAPSVAGYSVGNLKNIEMYPGSVVDTAFNMSNQTGVNSGTTNVDMTGFQRLVSQLTDGTNDNRNDVKGLYTAAVEQYGFDKMPLWIFGDTTPARFNELVFTYLQDHKGDSMYPFTVFGDLYRTAPSVSGSDAYNTYSINDTTINFDGIPTKASGNII